MSAWEVPHDHPAFAGHFPGHPILPGVVVLAAALEHVAQASATRVADWRLDQAKFVGAVRPGERLAFSHAAGERGGVRFEVHAGTRLVATGAMSRGAR